MTSGKSMPNSTANFFTDRDSLLFVPSPTGDLLTTGIETNFCTEYWAFIGYGLETFADVFLSGRENVSLMELRNATKLTKFAVDLYRSGARYRYSFARVTATQAR